MTYARMMEKFGDAKYLSTRMIMSSACMWAWSLLFFSNVNNSMFPFCSSELFFPMRLAYGVGCLACILVIRFGKANADPLVASLVNVVGVVLVLVAQRGLSSLACLGVFLMGMALTSCAVFNDMLRSSLRFGKESRLLAYSLFPAVGIYLFISALPHQVGIVCLMVGLVPLRFFHPVEKWRPIHRFSGTNANEGYKMPAYLEVYSLVLCLLVGTAMAFDVYTYEPKSLSLVYSIAAVCFGAACIFMSRFLNRFFSRMSVNNAFLAAATTILGFLLLAAPYWVAGDGLSYAPAVMSYIALVVGAIFFKIIRLDTAASLQGDEEGATPGRPVWFMANLLYPCGMVLGLIVVSLFVEPLWGVSSANPIGREHSPRQVLRL